MFAGESLGQGVVEGPEDLGKKVEGCLSVKKDKTRCGTNKQASQAQRQEEEKGVSTKGEIYRRLKV